MVCLSKQHDFSYEERVQEKTPYSPKFRYQRDPIGNRITSTTTETGSPVIRNYTSNNLNQYTAIDNPASTPAYDFDGNCTSAALESGEWTLTWNAENRMVKATSGTTIMEFGYDYAGREVYRKKTESGTITSHISYVWDGMNKIEELDALDSNAIAKKYVWGLDLTGSLTRAGGVGALLSETALSPAPYSVYPTYDANGNVTEYIDSTGTIQAHYEYSPFGKVVLSTGPKADDFSYRFSTKEFESNTGLILYQFRAYSSDLGRWQSRDPIGERGGINLMYFIENNSINWIDVLGLECLVVVMWGHGDDVKKALDDFNNEETGGHLRCASGIGCKVDGRNGKRGIGGNFPNTEKGYVGEGDWPDDNAGMNPDKDKKMYGEENKRKTLTGFANLMEAAWNAGIERARKEAEDCKCECTEIILEFRCVSEASGNNSKELKRRYSRDASQRFESKNAEGKVEKNYMDENKKIPRLPLCGEKTSFPCKRKKVPTSCKVQK